jgi:hypothetical protein
MNGILMLGKFRRDDEIDRLRGYLLEIGGFEECQFCKEVWASEQLESFNEKPLCRYFKCQERAVEAEAALKEILEREMTKHGHR